MTVEVDVANGLPNFQVVGLPDAAVSEARERVRAALYMTSVNFTARVAVLTLRGEVLSLPDGRLRRA